MSKAQKILVVDDDPRMCDSLKLILSIKGYETKTCNSGKEAIEYLNKNTFDLVLLDMFMPDINGCQIMDHINTQDSYTPVIVMTGDSSMQSVIDSLRRRAYDYLNKPFNPDEMLTAVGNAIDYRRLKSENSKLNGELSLTKERYRYLVQNSPDIIYTLDDKGNFTFISNAIKKSLNFETDQLIGKHYSEIIHEENLEKAKWLFNERRTGKRAAFGIELQLKICANRDGFARGKVRYLSMELKATGMYGRAASAAGRKFFGTHGVLRDISERKYIDAQLQQTQKMESIGTLAGGLAHDFNNLLATIIGNVSLAKNQVKPEDYIFDLLNEATIASTKAQMLTQQLLTFAKGGTPVKKVTSIKDVLKKTCSFVLMGTNSSFEFSPGEDLWPAEIDAGQMRQVIKNIVINAKQSMPDGGTIQVAAENVIIEDRHALPVNPGRYIRISIKDHGAGIAEKLLSRIFDPYFTTKQEGNSLGLAATYSIIKKHEGHITVESQLGVGTTFHIYIPASDKALPEKEEARQIKGQGRILVMDDEASLRKMVERMLKSLGYESELAEDGAEMIQMFKEAREAGNPYDAVIMDLTIPGGMGGKETINKLLEIDPEVKAIVSSGYSDDPVLANFQEYGFKGMLPKPFESLSLGKVLHEVIKGESVPDNSEASFIHAK